MGRTIAGDTRAVPPPRVICRAAPLALACLLAGCGDDLGGEGPGGSIDETGPFASQPDTSEGLVNVSADLSAVLEGGEIDGACERYRSGAASDRRARLLCGKEMFFRESFDTGGLPAALATHLVAYYPDEIGAGFERLGMVLDPLSDEGLPLGLAPTIPLGPEADVPALAFTCASCHFARLPDGRFAVGAPNHDYDYGRQILALGVYPLVALGLAGDHAPEAIAAIQPLLDRFEADSDVQDALLEAALSIAGAGSAPLLGVDVERQYASWLSGTQDFVIPPLPLDDGVHTISKIIDLWSIPTAEEESDAGMVHAMLAWSGGAQSLDEFVAGFALIGGQEPWQADLLSPLVDYIRSLRAPDNPAPPDPALAREGERLFGERGCTACHGGPRGSGLDLYTYEAIGTDDAMARWMDADGDGEPCCGVDLASPLTGKLKSPRLTGMWAKRRFLHNGSVASLDDLFCANGSRGAIVEPAYGEGGHEMTCGLAPADQAALVAYLLSH